MLKPIAATICAIATAPGRGGIGVIRVSGKSLLPFVTTLTGGKAPQPRNALYTHFLDAEGQALDKGLLLYFPAPHSFTGEDVIELHGHGGPVVLNMLLTRCIQLGARLAEPGEFTKRAFLNDKLDLAQAESVADLIDAASEAAARGALKSLKGMFSQEIHALVDALIQLRMLAESTLDFPEEEVDFLQASDALHRLLEIKERLQMIQRTAQQGTMLREGMNIVLVGQPNVGKSSLMNALAGDDVAIVSDIAGTTRDTVREAIVIEGIPVHIIDTAGLRDTNDVVEKIGIERTWRAIERADLVLLILEDGQQGFGTEIQTILAQLPKQLPRCYVLNKVDLSDQHHAGLGEQDGYPLVRLSARTHEGIGFLKAQILNQAGLQDNNDSVFLARKRHLEALHRAEIHLRQAEQVYAQLELLAEELRLAQSALSEITGEFTNDDLLGAIFSQFCIGK